MKVDGRDVEGKEEEKKKRKNEVKEESSFL